MYLCFVSCRVPRDELFRNSCRFERNSLTKGQRRLRRGKFRAQGPSSGEIDLAFSSETGVTGVSDEIALRTRSLPLSYSFFHGGHSLLEIAPARLNLFNGSLSARKTTFRSFLSAAIEERFKKCSEIKKRKESAKQIAILF